MAGKRILKSSMDWAIVAERVPPLQKDQLAAFKARSVTYMRKALSLPEEAPKIDWSHYKSKVSNKSLIESFEKQYAALKIPYHKADAEYAEIDAEEKDVTEKVDNLVKESNLRLEKLRRDLDAILNATPYNDMTVEEFYYMHPEFALRPLTKPKFFTCHRDWDLAQRDDWLDEKSVKEFRDIEWIHGPDEYHK